MAPRPKSPGRRSDGKDDPARHEAKVPARLRAEAEAAVEPKRPRSKAGPQVKRINLALQGGGSHGAFTWGVLDALLEDPRVTFDAISGTSAGAMNAVVLAAGWAENGRQGARDKLDAFWEAVADAGRFSPIQRTWTDRLLGNWRVDSSPGYLTLDFLSRFLSPYQTNPLKINPLRDVLVDLVDIDKARHEADIKLFISATNVRSGKIRVFENHELSIDAVMASACLPTMFQAVEVEGEHYYDGGYMGNPALYPLIYNSECRDIVIVQINPMYRDTVPTDAREIMDRVNEISFNSTLMREMRAIHFVNRLIAAGKLDPEAYRVTRIHMIEASEEMQDMHASSKLNAERAFLHHLRDIGRTVATTWLEESFGCVGTQSSIDVRGTFL
ncbi:MULTISPECIES: patatin-like phospholipase family protein [Thalassobaculum]|uniref:NTE family protein n=1 Tax=Thalassobaculum litoreum DSM 18839 TaxID=1123362 RepID=A0A8G2F1U3_9PROT|nr:MULTISPECIES: patatin-like phospholipase family protein [Thalassobaculum]SDF27701.1 NTE family protein [Thalassobaculum litoreum DSM 18839]